MKNFILLSLSFFTFFGYSQEHFSGISTSSRVGIITAGMNPAELINIENTYEANVIGMSVNITNNKIGFKDLLSNSKLEELIFQGSDAVNLRFDAEIYGPSFAMKYKKWAFGITTKANAKLDIVDVDVKIGDAINNAGINSLFGSTTFSNNYNQRVSGTTWGEIGLTAARDLYITVDHKFSAGATFKFLFPGSFANLGVDKFQGTITNSVGQSYLNNTNANLNIAYSGSLANNFSNFNDYSKSVFGNLNGFSTDIGFNYQWKDNAANPSKYKNKYRVNAGLAIRNIGTMTFKDNNNSSSNYKLVIPPATLSNPGLNLNQFDNTNNLQDIETTLQNSGYLTTTKTNKNFKVKLPTVLSAYADVKLVSKVFVSGFIQQKINNDSDNDQIAVQNVVTLTPRFNSGFFEVFSPLSNSQVSGFNAGLGFRVGGFYLGSSSILTAISSNSKRADVYTGFRWSFL